MVNKQTTTSIFLSILQGAALPKTKSEMAAFISHTQYCQLKTTIQTTTTTKKTSHTKQSNHGRTLPSNMNAIF